MASGAEFWAVLFAGGLLVAVPLWIWGWLWRTDAHNKTGEIADEIAAHQHTRILLAETADDLIRLIDERDQWQARAVELWRSHPLHDTWHSINDLPTREQAE